MMMELDYRGGAAPQASVDCAHYSDRAREFEPELINNRQYFSAVRPPSSAFEPAEPASHRAAEASVAAAAVE